MDRVLLVQEEPRDASELVEVPVTASGLFRINFPDIQQLRSLVSQAIRINGMRLITPAVASFGPILQMQCAPLTEIVKCFLVLYVYGWEKAHYVPLFVLNDMSTPTVAAPSKFAAVKFSNFKNVDWSKSYILFAGPVGSDVSGGNYEFMFDVEYTKLDASGKEILGPS